MTRVYGRIPATAGGDAETLAVGKPYRWVVVETDDRGFDDYCHLTALVQCLKLNLGESPFYANFGLPAKTSVLQQIPPDYAVAFTQSFFAKFFASLIVTKAYAIQPATPTYNISVVRKVGGTFETEVAL